jgi:MFS family permease
MENKERGSWMYVVIGILTVIVAVAFARMAYGVILPYMSESLSLSYKESGFLGTVTALGYLGLVLVAGIVAAKWGSKKTILFGVSSVTIGFLGLSLSANYAMTILFMLLLGMGTAFTFTPLISLVTAWFPEKRGLVIGLVTSGVGIGLLFTGAIVPILGEVYGENGWRLAWALFALLGLITLVLIFTFIKDPPGIPRNIKEKQGFVTPSNPVKVYKNPRIILVGIIYGIVGFTFIIQSIFIMSFMIKSGLDSSKAGQLIAMNGIISIFSGPIWGFVSDRFGRHNSLIVTMTLNFVATILLVVMPTFLGFVLHIVILSSTLTGLFTLIQASSMEQVEPPDMPIAFSYTTFYFAIGQLLGPVIAGWLIEEANGFRSVFVVSSSTLVIGILLTVTLKVVSKDIFYRDKVRISG